jgi:hypothetical protein
MLRPAAQIASTHRGDAAAALKLSEGLHLEGAGEGDDDVGQGVQWAAGQAGDQQDGAALGQQKGQPPVEAGTVPKSAPEQLRRQNPQGEGQNGEQIVQGLVQLPLGQVDPHQDDVAGLRGGKDLAAVEIAVPVQQTAGQSQQKADWKRFRGLELFHGCASFRNPAQKDTTSFGIGQGERRFFEKIYLLSCFLEEKGVN